MKGRTGTSVGSVEVSAAARRRAARRRRRENAEWRAKNGPVTVRFVDPATLKKNP